MFKSSTIPTMFWPVGNSCNKKPSIDTPLPTPSYPARHFSYLPLIFQSLLPENENVGTVSSLTGDCMTSVGSLKGDCLTSVGSPLRQKPTPAHARASIVCVRVCAHARARVCVQTHSYAGTVLDGIGVCDRSVPDRHRVNRPPV